MPDIFNSRSGYVAIFPGERVIPGKIVLKGFEPKAALISSIDYNQSTNHQFQTSLDGSVYIYVFGDQMGNVVISGIAFPITCTGDEEGLLEVLKYYAENRASKQSVTVKVSVGKSEVIEGFLTAISIRGPGTTEEPSKGFLSEYRLMINTLPKG